MIEEPNSEDRRIADLMAAHIRRILPGKLLGFSVEKISRTGDQMLIKAIDQHGAEYNLSCKPSKSKLALIEKALDTLEADGCSFLVRRSDYTACLNLSWVKRERPVIAEEFGSVFDEGHCSLLAIKFRMQQIG